jgi:hypothetical protein
MNATEQSLNNIFTPPLHAAPAPAVPAAAGRPVFKRLLREPLIHFVVLGALVFGADQALLALRGNPQEIVVGPAVVSEAREVFKAGMKREPSAAELKILTDRWVDNEVLYREGIALGLDRGDSTIRDRVIFKAMSVVQSGQVLPAIDEAGLRAWFETRRKRYDEPTRLDFQEAVVAGDKAADALQAFVAALNGSGKSDTESSLRVFKDRPYENLVQSYGQEFADDMQRGTPGRWVLMNSMAGPRVVRLEAVKPGRAASFDDIKTRVYQDWKDETNAQMTIRSIREIGRKYRIRNKEASS